MTIPHQPFVLVKGSPAWTVIVRRLRTRRCVGCRAEIPNDLPTSTRWCSNACRMRTIRRWAAEDLEIAA